MHSRDGFEEYQARCHRGGRTLATNLGAGPGHGMYKPVCQMLTERIVTVRQIWEVVLDMEWTSQYAKTLTEGIVTVGAYPSIVSPVRICG
jgi:hypothetical protein